MTLKFIYLAPSTQCAELINWPGALGRFDEKMKFMKSQYLCIMQVTTGSQKSLQQASPPSTLQKRCLGSLFITFSDYGKKSVIFDKIYSFDCGIYLTLSAECPEPINHPTAVKGLEQKYAIPCFDRVKVHYKFEHYIAL